MSVVGESRGAFKKIANTFGTVETNTLRRLHIRAGSYLLKRKLYLSIILLRRQLLSSFVSVNKDMVLEPVLGCLW